MRNVLTNNVNFNIFFFDKDKIHSLFYKKGILYSEISNKEIYLLPILIKKIKSIFIIIIIFMKIGIIH